jgi:16S rRNA (adenine1518-N6/adenine1519-N6)-dimethyltransferase
MTAINLPLNLRLETEQLTKLYGVRPQHNKGQNFLIQAKVYKLITKAAEIQPTDEILEIGPGWGFLTILLAQQAKRVVSVELDQRLAEILPNRLALADCHNVEIVNDDILKIVINRPDLAEHSDLGNINLAEGYKIVANLPYNITSICLRRFLAGEVQRPSLMVLMVQEEVARRLIAQPGEMSLLSLLAQYYSQIEYIMAVPAVDFWPQPQVNSAIVRFRLTKPLLSPADEKIFWRLAKFGFSARRKMLKNNLVAGLKINETIIAQALEKIGQKTTCRAQELRVEQWIELVAILKGIML